ncbi:CAP domain-containing protein [Puniceibacterium sediminis]|uniref:Cysteine-rich secretory protein family protein n=1 Tax=Puniceibacterium sediminis TaxID=1608407 RepID=A0A238VRA1_9RHOB|nr:CAP domain-containing protein [Puniceibacterium sediminis]SNR36711.1 Cysteine-rich secretory protein family protein [Puniceibacterium sediminis]
MTRISFLLIPLALALAACAPAPVAPTIGADGRPLPKVYRINSADEARVEFRMLDAVNALRDASGVPALQMNAALNAAAATHSRDMSVQNRPWHFGSDGSSPIERVQRVGYIGIMLGENISETYETELETLAAWMETPATRDVILDENGRDLGFAWFQESSGKIWWTLIVGGNSVSTQAVGFGS